MISRLLRNSKIVTEISEQIGKQIAKSGKSDAIQAAGITAKSNIKAANINSQSRIKSAQVRAGISAATAITGGFMAWHYLEPTKQKLKESEDTNKNLQNQIDGIKNELYESQKYLYFEHTRPFTREELNEVAKEIMRERACERQKYLNNSPTGGQYPQFFKAVPFSREELNAKAKEIMIERAREIAEILKSSSSLSNT